MADREEQLLNDLLREVAREDAALDARHLETRVLDACDTPTVSGFSPIFSAGPKNSTRPAFGSIAIFLAAAASLALVIATTLPRPGPQPVQPSAESAPPQAHTEVPIAPVLPKPRKRAPKVVPAPAAPVQVNTEAVERPAPVLEPAASESPAEFVPLMPLTAQDLAGPFQLVRVQMPRASLGPLRSPLDHPAELVEADVLLGEDGRARAIRISAAGSIYPWRRPR